MDINPSAKSNRLLRRSARDNYIPTPRQSRDKRTRTGNFLTSVLYPIDNEFDFDEC